MIARVVLAVARGCLRRLQTDRTRVGPIRRAVLATLLLPPFGFLLVVLRLRLLVRGPLTVDATTAFGARVRCRPPDLIQMYICLFGIWEPDLTAFIRDRLGPGDGFIDVGANIGYFSLLAATRVGPTGRVTAIEAAPAICAELERNLATSDAADRVRVVNKAASDRTATLDMFAGPDHNIGLTTTVPHRGLHRTGSVEARPLADLVHDEEARAARLIKIDVEGAEDAVLAGAMPLLERTRDDLEIIVELSPQWWRNTDRTPADVLAPWIEAGFHVYTMDNDYWPWRYLWPASVQPPRRYRGPLDRRVARLDVVLSRVDADLLH